MENESVKKIGILGAGSWGMALARSLANAGHSVSVWTFHTDKLDKYAAERRYPHLDNMVIPETIVFEKNIASLCAGKDVILMAVPSVNVRETMRLAAGHMPDGQIVVNAAKGIEPDSLMTLTEVIEDEFEKSTVPGMEKSASGSTGGAAKTAAGGNRHCRAVALSGPTHAEEVARDLPSTIVSSSADMAAAEYVQDVFMNNFLRVYTNDDVLGIELCGALKNIIALASGISSGIGFGDNTKAALITRGLAEITRLGMAMGCRRETFAGLAGMGDLIVTATSVHSRNNRCGYYIGQGASPEDAVRMVGMVVEGINALPAAMELSEKYKVELPICEAVNAIINKGAGTRETVSRLMLRDKKNESV